MDMDVDCVECLRVSMHVYYMDMGVWISCTPELTFVFFFMIADEYLKKQARTYRQGQETVSPIAITLYYIILITKYIFMA